MNYQFGTLLLALLATFSFRGVSTDSSGSYVGRTKVCYYTSWAHSRTGPSGNYSAESIDFSLCTHVVYSFLGLDPANYKVKILDPAADLADNGGLGLIEKLVTAAEKHRVSVLIAVGGWTESANEAWPKLFANETLMDTFVGSVVEFLKKYKCQGVDLDYEYPGCPQGTCKYGDEGKRGFSTLVVKLRAAFKESGFLLTAAVSGAVDKIDTYYNTSVLEENLDWIGLMAYDYSIGTNTVIGLTAPLDKVKASVEGWLAKGVSAAKLVLGVPLYGVSFTLADAAKNTIGSAASGVGALGSTLRYNEICANIKTNGWTAVSVAENGGTFAYKENQWVGYDAIPDMKTKGKYVLEKKLAGYMCWSLDQDDFMNVCGDGKYPLLTAISNALDGK